MQKYLLKTAASLALSILGLATQAQDFTITPSKASGSCGNQKVNFEAGFVEIGTTYAFDSGQLPEAWSSSPYNVGQACSGIFADTPDDSDYFWATINNEDGFRFVATNDQNVSVGGQISFSMRFGRDDPSGGCENPDEPSEGVYLQYSTDEGAHWTTIKYWVPTRIGELSPEGLDLYSWNTFNVVVPEEAKSTSTRFRWFQPSNSGSSYDNWGLDDISVFVMREAQSYSWNIGDGQTYENQNLEAQFDSNGTKSIQCTVVDSEGDSYTSTITYDVVMDNEAPTAKATNYFLILDENGEAELIADYLDAGSTDNCGEVKFSVDKTTFSCAELGDNNVNLSVSDNAGNTSTIEAIVTIYDFTAPQVLTKNINVALDSAGTLSLNPAQIDGGSMDACSFELSFSLDKSEFTYENLGENTVRLTATDESGNQNSATATLTISDAIAPYAYEVVLQKNTASKAEAEDFTFTIANAEIGANYEYIISGDGATVNGGGKVNDTEEVVSGINMSSLEDGEITISVVLSDAYGNRGEAAHKQLLKETSEPTVAISRDKENESIVNISFSEEVKGFTLENIVVENATLSELRTNDQKNFSIEVTPIADGNVSLQLPAGVVSDAAGNGNTASEVFSYLYDGNAPQFSLSTEAKVYNQPFQLWVDFDEEVKNFTLEDIQLSQGKASDLQTLNNKNFSVFITPTTDGELQVSIEAGAVQDMGGNTNKIAQQTIVHYDATAPAGYAIVEPLAEVNSSNLTDYTIKLEGLEEGAQVFYSISGGNVDVKGEFVATQSQMSISGLDMRTLPDGALNLNVYLLDAAANRGEVAEAKISKSTQEILSVEALAAIEVSFATTFDALPLPQHITAQCSDGEHRMKVQWQRGSYTSDQPDTYHLKGEIISETYSNPQNLKAGLSVRVLPNAAPAQISLSRHTFTTADEEPVGYFATQDADDDTHSYSLVAGLEDNDNHFFSIVDDALYFNYSRSLGKQKDFSIRVESKDAQGNSLQTSFKLALQDVELPTEINFVNTFSPNGDGINDQWVVSDLKFFKEVQIEVYDRAGRRVFQSSDPEQGWDGRVNGSVAGGGFYYIITVNDIQLTKRGVLSVIK